MQNALEKKGLGIGKIVKFSLVFCLEARCQETPDQPEKQRNEEIEKSDIHVRGPPSMRNLILTKK